MNSGTKRQCDRALAAPRGSCRGRPPPHPSPAPAMQARSDTCQQSASRDARPRPATHRPQRPARPSVRRRRRRRRACGDTSRSAPAAGLLRLRAQQRCGTKRDARWGTSGAGVRTPGHPRVPSAGHFHSLACECDGNAGGNPNGIVSARLPWTRLPVNHGVDRFPLPDSRTLIIRRRVV
jgi:hypothetical protein